MPYFKPKGRVNQEMSQGDMSLIIDNSQTIYLGQAVIISGGYVQPAGTTGKILGVVVAIVDSKGRPLDTTFAKTSFAGTFTGGGPGVQKYVSASDNVTVDQVKVLVVTDKQTVFVNTVDAAVTAAQLFKYFNIKTGTNALQLAAYVGNVAGQFQLIQIDPDGDGVTGKGAFVISESVWDAYVIS